jgi:beta-lactamase class A
MTTPPLPAPLAARLRPLERRFSGVLGLWVHDLEHDEIYGHQAERRFRPASTIKLFVLVELYRQQAARQVRMSDQVVVTARARVPGSGVIKDLSPGLRLTLKDAATLMITISDNTATNLLIDRLGLAAINRGIRAAGFRDTRLGGKLFRAGGLQRSASTPHDMGVLMSRIARGEALSRSASAGMRDILFREQSDTIVGRFLPYDPFATSQGRSPWRIASKSGSLRGVRHDVAYVVGPRLRYVVALMSKGCKDRRFWPDNEATLCLARAARVVHDHVARAG